jgi:hypothetical protein
VIASLIPLLTNALLITGLSFAMTYRYLPKLYLPGAGYRSALALILLAMSLIPFAQFSLAFYFAGLFGALSVTTCVLLCTYLFIRCSGRDFSGVLKSEVLSNDLASIYVLVAFTAIFLYPSALGISMWDFYSEGYYPVILSPLIFSIFAFSVYRGSIYLAVLLGLVFAAFILQLGESDNLWDYLLDPVLAIYCLVKLRGAISNLRARTSKEAMEAAGLSIAGSFLLFAVFLSRINHDAFRYRLVVEDGFTESITALVLFIVMLVCISRLVKLWHLRSRTFLAMTAFIAFVGLFGAGEEISWGQRIFNWDSPEYFLEHNKQEETGLHNLVVEVNGKKLSINKIIFGTGLALAMVIYLFIMTPIYRRHRQHNGPFSRFIDDFAIPMPRNYHAIGYLVVLATVELLVDSSKRGEMTEFAGSIVFLLNVAFPYNSKIFELNHGTSGQHV